MMLTIENTSGIGRPIKIFDANGREVLFAITADTETGEVEKYKTGERGQLIRNEEKGEIEREKVLLAFPLRFEYAVT